MPNSISRLTQNPNLFVKKCLSLGFCVTPESVLMFRLECAFGSKFIKKLGQKVALQSNRVTTQDADNNFINADLRLEGLTQNFLQKR